MNLEEYFITGIQWLYFIEQIHFKWNNIQCIAKNRRILSELKTDKML